jgi:glycosyltransferase involved in cell wall biosynthesis
MAKKKSKKSKFSGAATKQGTPLLQNAINKGKVRIVQDGQVKNASVEVGERLKVLVWGASPYVITGFGVVMRKLLQNLFSSFPGKYDVYQVGINHLGDAYDEFEITGGPNNGRYQQWPAMQAGSQRHHMYGQNKFLQLLAQSPVDFDVIFLFEDPFWIGGVIPGTNPPKVFMDEIKKVLAHRGKSHIPIVSYYPIDGVPHKEWILRINQTDIPITYLNFGAQASVNAVPEIQNKIKIIPHGVDPEEFYPISEKDKRLFRRAMFGDGFADKFMFLNVNRNQLRKLVPSSLLAFKEFQRQTGGAGFIYLNMKAKDVGWDLPRVCQMIGLRIGTDVILPPNFNVQKGLTLQQLNSVFNCADLLVTSAVGGGWELAITQAFATKTPVLAPRNTSHVELCGKDQSSVDTMRGMLYESGGSLSRIMIFPNDNEVPRPLPNVEDMLEKMLFLYENKEFREQMAENAYNWAMSSLRWKEDVAFKFDECFTAAKKLKEQRLRAMSVPASAAEGKDAKTSVINIPAGEVV